MNTVDPAAAPPAITASSATRLAPRLRNRLLVIVFGATLPVAAIGLWAVSRAQDSGRTLLRSRLDAELAQTERQVARVWMTLRSNLLTLGENESVRLLLSDTAAAPTPPAFVTTAFAQMTAIDHVVVRDRENRVRLRLDAPGLARPPVRPGSAGGAEPAPSTFGVPVRLPLTDLMTGDTIGTLEAVVRLAMLVPNATQPASPDGPLLAVSTTSAGSLYPAGVDKSLFTDESVRWQQERWTTVRRTLREPDITLALAGALSPYQEPFTLAARRNTVALLIAFVVIGGFSARYAARLAREIGQELAQREALATVGEFASELAHEVRNPLTAMRLDLQRAEECTDDPAVLREIVQRVLGQVSRLDRAVSGALRVSRSSSIAAAPLDLRRVLETARLSADPEFVRRGATLTISLPEQPLTLNGDADALEQLFLNLMLNAAQALPEGGVATARASAESECVIVEIQDDGVGMTPAQLRATSQPHRSSRRDGNGLGLKVARRIVATHGGTLTLSSRFGEGTCARIAFPRAGSPS